MKLWFEAARIAERGGTSNSGKEANSSSFESGPLLLLKSLSLSSFIEKVVEIKRSLLDRRSMTGYQATADRLLQFAKNNGLADQPVSSFTTRHAGAFLAWFLESGYRP